MTEDIKNIVIIASTIVTTIAFLFGPSNRSSTSPNIDSQRTDNDSSSPAPDKPERSSPDKTERPDFRIALSFAALLAAVWGYVIGDWMNQGAFAMIFPWTIALGVFALILSARNLSSFRTAVALLSVGAALILALSPESRALHSDLTIHEHPIVTLLVGTAIAATAWYPNYTANRSPWSVLDRRSPYMWGLICAALLTSYAIGAAAVNYATNDPRAPVTADTLPFPWPSDAPEAFRGTPLDDATAYRLASEFRLIETYQDNSRTIDVETAYGAYYRQQTAGGFAQAGAAMPEDERPHDRLPNIFAPMTEEQQRTYLNDRMKWVHALPPINNTSLRPPLPGISATERFSALGDARSAAALLSAPSQTRFLGTYAYSPIVQEVVDPRNRSIRRNSLTTGFMQLLGRFAPNPIYAYLPMFASLPFHQISIDLQRQLAVQPVVESWIAAQQYEQYAVRYAQDHLADSEARDLIPRYRALSAQMQTAFTRQVFALGEDYPNVLRALQSLSSLDDSSLRILRQLSASEIEGVADLLRRACPPDTLAYATDHERQAVIATLDSSADQDLPTSEPRPETSHATYRRQHILVSASLICSQVTERSLRIDLGTALAQGTGDTRTLLLTSAAFDFSRAFLAAYDTDDPTLSDIFTDGHAYALRSLAQQAGDPVSRFLSDFQKLPISDQEKVLLYFAQSRYSWSGPQSLAPLLSLVARIRAEHRIVAYLLASLFSALALGLVALPLAWYMTRLLANHRMAAARIKQQDGALDPEGYDRLERHTLVGREATVDRLRRIARTQRGTVALSGERGCGKSKILRQVYQTEKRHGALAVWMDCPAHYSQRDFVWSLFGRVLSATDAYAAHLLGKPNREAMHWIGTSMRNIAAFMSLFLILGIAITISIAGRDDRSQLSWVPYTVALVSIPVTFLVESRRMLASRDGTKVRLTDEQRHNWQYMTVRVREESPDLSIRIVPPISLLVAGAISFLLGLSPGAGSLSIAFVAASPVLIFSAAVAGAGAVVGRYSRVKELKEEPVISMITRYRRFVTEAASRTLVFDGASLPKAASTSQDTVSVPGASVFIDEIDKIVDIGDARSFLREAKPLFDIPQCRFYLSIAEDVADCLNMRGNFGTNEIGSTLDHIETVRMLERDECLILLNSYLTDVESQPLCRSMESAIAGLSRGNARDLLRLADWARLGYAASWMDLVIEEARRLAASITTTDLEHILAQLKEAIGTRSEYGRWNELKEAAVKLEGGAGRRVANIVRTAESVTQQDSGSATD